MVTFAKASEKLGKRAAKYEEMLNSPHKADRNTAERMLSRIDTMLEQMQFIQEAATKNLPDGKSMGWGGPIEDDNIEFDNEWLDMEDSGSGFKNWANKNEGTLKNLGSTVFDAVIRQAAIGSMKGPKDPIYSPYVHMDTTVDNSGALNDITRSTIIRNRAIDKNLRDNNVIAAHKSKAFADSINAKNKVYAAGNKEQRELRRMKMYTDYRTNMYNASLANRHNSEVTDFHNNKAAATANNVSNAVRNFRLGENDNFGNKMDGLRMDMLGKQFEGSGVWGRLMNDPQIRSRMQSLYPNLFN